jgi:hypothetical protein
MRQTAIAVLALVVTCICGSPGHATSFVVDASGAGDFETIQEAVNVATGRDTILIRQGLYEENVLSEGKYLTFIGEGAGVTVLRAIPGAPALEIRGMTEYPRRTRLYDMTVEGSPADTWAIYWDRRRVEIYRCELVGAVGSWEEDMYGAVVLSDCSATSVCGSGYGTPSSITNSEVDSVRFRGEWHTSGYGWTAYAPHVVEVTGSCIGVVRLEGGRLDSVGDEIGVVTGDIHADCLGEDSSFESIFVGSDLQLIRCTVEGDASLIGGTAMTAGVFTGISHVEESFVAGDLTVEVWEHPSYPITTKAFVGHSTILGDFICDYDTPAGWQGYQPQGVVSNIIGGSSYVNLEFIDFPVVTHNDFVGGYTVLGPPDNVHSNMSEPPLFCDPDAGNYGLQECSPCVGAAHDGGDMGLFGVQCACVTVVVHKSWGSIKAMYRQPPN